MSSPNCLKIVQTIRSLVHLTHFPFTISVISLYSGANKVHIPSKLSVYIGMLIMFSMV